ncbi:hypothetical protein ACIP1T_19040 [Pseudomonas japonica]|uniref:hypothetical protein n=1 Tax=Pseudomonas japonica TaxID=256466 RepID=UPI0038163036
MKNSHQRAEKALEAALSNTELKVIALTGAWGTGKTHLWKSIIQDRTDVLEISAFGAKTIDEIKIKILQSETALENHEAAEISTNATKIFKDLSTKFFGINTVNIALMALPRLVKKKIIIVDDIERKHKSLDIDEILGLINEYSEKYDSRFLLILNTDNLDGRNIWQEFHEKIIDKEVVLDPSPADSFAIAATGANEPFLSIAKETVEKLKIKNVRVIRKILSALREILKTQKDLHEPLLQRYIPSLVFLCAAYYRVLGNELTLDYIANKIFNRSQDKDNDELNAAIRKSGLTTEKIAEITIDFLTLGVLNHDDIDTFFSPLKENLAHHTFRKSIDDFTESLFWDPDLSDETVEDFCARLSEKVYELDAAEIARLVRDLEQSEFKDHADQLLSKWLALATEDNQIHKKFRSLYDKKIHPKLLQLQEQLPPQPEHIASLKETIQSYLAGNHLTQQSINVLANTSQEEYEEALRSLGMLELKDFIELHFRLGEKRREAHWSSAQEKFIAACTHIYEHEPDTKLARILRRELKKREPVKPSEGSN